MTKAIIYISGIIGKETTLVDVIRQFKAYEDPTEIELKIHSEGGDVDEGNKIHGYFENLKKTIPLNTSASKAYSISAKLFSLGTERIVEEGENRIMIHFAWANVKGKAEKLEKVAEELRGLEDEFATYYSEFLNVDEETARGLLDTNTFFNAEEALELGFATETKEATKAVAMYNSNKNENKMSTKTQKSALQVIVDAAKNFLSITEEGQEINALELQDSNGATIDFPEVEEGQDPVEGSVGNIDGSPVEDGEYIMPSMENKILVFVDGAVSEVKDAVIEDENEDEVETEEEIQARLLIEEEARIAAEEIQQISVWSQEASNTSFEVGEQMTYEYDGESFNYGAGEYYVPSIDKNVVTDASGVIVAHKDKVVVSETVEDTTETSEVMEARIEEKVSATISAKYDAQIEAQKKTITALNKKIGSEEIVAVLETETSTKSKNVSGLANILRNKKANQAKK